MWEGEKVCTTWRLCLWVVAPTCNLLEVTDIQNVFAVSNSGIRDHVNTKYHNLVWDKRLVKKASRERRDCEFLVPKIWKPSLRYQNPDHLDNYDTLKMMNGSRHRVLGWGPQQCKSIPPCIQYLYILLSSAWNILISTTCFHSFNMWTLLYLLVILT